MEPLVRDESKTKTTLCVKKGLVKVTKT